MQNQPIICIVYDSKLRNLHYYTIITTPVLHSVELDVKPDQLVAVVGQVGAPSSRQFSVRNQHFKNSHNVCIWSDG